MEMAVELEGDLHGGRGRHRSTGSHAVDSGIDFAGGVLAGVANVYSGQPLDTVKVKMQTYRSLYRNSIDCFWRTLTKQGLARGLYAGTVPALAANIAENSILFCGYGACQKCVAWLRGKPDIAKLNPVENALAGSGGAFLATFALCPTELVKCRLQALKEAQSTGRGALARVDVDAMGPVRVTMDILKTDGVRGLFRGLMPTFMREVPGYFFFFGAYEMARKAVTPAGKTKEDIGALRTMLCGGLGGVALWGLMFPFDVVKSRVQIDGKGAMWPTMVQIVRSHGVRALYNGLAPTLLRTFISSACLWITFETSTSLMHSLF